MKTFDIDTGYEIYTDCTFKIGLYTNGNLAIFINDDGDYPLCRLTTNLHVVDPDCAYLDVNNCEFAEKLVKDLDIATFTGIETRSGFVTYPLYKFNIEKLERYTKH